jgi:hypothetical protein
MSDNSYQPKVYKEQGGDVLVVASGGTFKIEDGASFFFDNSTYEVTQSQLKSLLYGAVKSAVTIGQGAVSTVFSVVNLSYSKRYIILSMTSTCVSGSAFLTSGPVVGQELYIMVRSGSCASGAVVVSCSGVSLVALGHDHSRFTLYNSDASAGCVHLICINDGEWSVMDSDKNSGSLTFT